MSDDEVGQEVGQNIRVVLTIAMQMGEKFARLREELARDSQARSAAQARELSARFDAERGAARATLQVVDRSEWWNRASVQDISRVAETAQAWKGQDPIAERAAAVVQREVLERYGVDTAVLRDAAGQAKSELDLAKEWAINSAPEHYHRHDDDRLTMQVRDRAEPDVNAERALITDYRAALAGDAGTLELSAAEEWKRDTDPAGFQGYRVQTSIDWNDGQFSTLDPAAVAAARTALVEEWKDAVAPERARVGVELTKAQQLIADADRLDRANDTRADGGAREVPGAADVDNGAAIQAAKLEARAKDYDRDAEAGGTAHATPDELRELAADARAQAQLFRDDAPSEQKDATQSANGATADFTAPPATDPRASASREAGEVAYDSSERRRATVAAMESKGVPPYLIEARMSADSAHATPASSAATSREATSAVPSTRRSRGQGMGAERGDLSR